MPLERSFRIALLTLVLAGALALTLALGSVLWLVGSVAVFAACVVWGAARPAWHLSRGVGTLIIVITAQAVVVESLTTGALLVPAAHFLLVSQFVWLTQERNNRHYGWLCLMSLLQVMLAGVLSVDLAFGVCFLVFLPAGVTTLLLYNLRCELERNGELTPSRMPRVGMRLLMGAGLVAVAELVLSVLIFAYFPRFGIQILQLKPVQKGSRLSGFSDRVRFGDLARVLDNPEVVMHVRLSRNGRPVQADTFPLLLRGISLDTYQHATWSTRDYYRDSGIYQLPFTSGPHDVPSREDIVQDIVLEPINTRVLFYLPSLVRLRSATPNLDDVLYHRVSGTFSSVRGNAVSLRYIVRSRIPNWRAEELRRPTPQAGGREPPTRYLQLPDTITQRAHDLAQQIVRDVPESHVYERVKTVELCLRGRYRYSLRSGVRTYRVDPVEDFLFRARQGHCEHFAASMVVLLRSLGVQSRVVTGFSGGEWNEYGQFYVIRQRNAHAWVEAYIPAVGNWVTFDPTPASSRPGSLIAHGWLGSMSRRAAYLRLWWNTNVVNYSSRDQRKLAEAATHFLSRLPGRLSLWGSDQLVLDSGHAAGLGALIVFGALALLWGAYALVAYVLGRRFNIPWWRRKRRRGVPAVGFYRRMDDVLRRRGFVREPSTTPREFATAVLERGGERYQPVEVVTEAFCRVRYGGGRLSAAERASVHQALAALEARKA